MCVCVCVCVYVYVCVCVCVLVEREFAAVSNITSGAVGVLHPHAFVPLTFEIFRHDSITTCISVHIQLLCVTA